jgi:hypothetical protein
MWTRIKKSAITSVCLALAISFLFGLFGTLVRLLSGVVPDLVAILITAFTCLFLVILFLDD